MHGKWAMKILMHSANCDFPRPMKTKSRQRVARNMRTSTVKATVLAIVYVYAAVSHCTVARSARYRFPVCEPGDGENKNKRNCDTSAAEQVAGLGGGGIAPRSIRTTGAQRSGQRGLCACSSKRVPDGGVGSSIAEFSPSSLPPSSCGLGRAKWAKVIWLLLLQLFTGAWRRENDSTSRSPAAAHRTRFSIAGQPCNFGTYPWAGCNRWCTRLSLRDRVCLDLIT